MRTQWNKEKIVDNTLCIYSLICCCLKYYFHSTPILTNKIHCLFVYIKHLKHFICLSSYINGVPAAITTASLDKFKLGSGSPFQTASAHKISMKILKDSIFALVCILGESLEFSFYRELIGLHLLASKVSLFCFIMTLLLYLGIARNIR